MAAARKNGIERRDALLDAALRCFSEQGILHTGIEDVRKAAGASPSSVYHQFAGLNEIVVALLMRIFQRVLGHIEARVLAATTLEAAVRALVGAHLEWVIAHPTEARFMYQAMALELDSDDRGRLVAAKGELKRRTLAHVAALGGTALRRWSPLEIETVLLGAAHQACRLWLAGGAIDPAWMRANLPETAWRAIAPRARSRKRPATKRSREARERRRRTATP